MSNLEYETREKETQRLLEEGSLKIIDGKLCYKGIDQVLLEERWFPLKVD